MEGILITELCLTSRVIHSIAQMGASTKMCPKKTRRVPGTLRTCAYKLHLELAVNARRHELARGHEVEDRDCVSSEEAQDKWVED